MTDATQCISPSFSRSQYQNKCELVVSILLEGVCLLGLLVSSINALATDHIDEDSSFFRGISPHDEPETAVTWECVAIRAPGAARDAGSQRAADVVATMDNLRRVPGVQVSTLSTQGGLG